MRVQTCTTWSNATDACHECQKSQILSSQKSSGTKPLLKSTADSRREIQTGWLWWGMIAPTAWCQCVDGTRRKIQDFSALNAKIIRRKTLLTTIPDTILSEHKQPSTEQSLKTAIVSGGGSPELPSWVTSVVMLLLEARSSKPIQPSALLQS